MEKEQNNPLWHGVVLVAGGAIGAGMFALPLASAGAWFPLAALGMFVVWWFTYCSATILIDVNLEFPRGSSFDTLVRSVLGPRWAALNNISIAFIMYILMYAYITAGAGIIEFSLGRQIEGLPGRRLLSVMFAGIVALFIWIGTSAVSRVSTLLLVGMGLSFVAANAGLLQTADWQRLVNSDVVTNSGLVWGTLPVFVTAFACGGLVPSLIRHYPQQSKRIYRSVFYGSVMALTIYLIWLCATMGNIPRERFADVAANGGGLSAIVDALQAQLVSDVSGPTVSGFLVWFSHFAVITSFLSIALGLAHFLSDRFAFNDGSLGKLKSVGIAFIPPMILSVLVPYGFVKAIGYAGLFVALSFFVVPALMHHRFFEHENTRHQPRPWRLVLGFGVLIILLKLASLSSVLPSFPA